LSRIQGDLTPRAKRGMVGAVFRILSTGIGTIGSVLGGYIYGLDSKYPFWMDAVLSATAIPLITVEGEVLEQLTAASGGAS